MALQRYAVIWVLFIGVIAGCGKSGERVTVLAAASTSNTIKKLAAEFEAQHPEIQVEVVTGASNGLAQQILAGSPADLFVSANQRWAEEVVSAGLAKSSRPLLNNRLVLIVPSGNPAKIQSLEDLRTNTNAKLSLAGRNVPAGIYARQSLERLEIFEPLESEKRIIRGSDVRIAMAYVERGEVDAGIVYATDARISEQVEIVAELDSNSHDPIVYELVKLNGSNSEAANQFMLYLLSTEAATQFEESGFGVGSR